MSSSLPTSPAIASPDWKRLIQEAIATPDPTLSNFKITRLHYLLSCRLLEVIGPAAGANFHSWAVWGSRKAGVTIRQEDKDQASRDATVVAGIVGGIVGALVGWLSANSLGFPTGLSIIVWILIGTATGGVSGYLLAGYTRRAAARLILAGNRTVLDDIGQVTANYLAYVDRIDNRQHDCEAEFATFLATLRPGATEQGGQDLLRQAFINYETARRNNDAKTQHECNYFANCLAVLHEHIRLQPYISKSLPFLISKCVTQRLMTYSVGEQLLAVHEDVPPLADAAFPTTLMTISSPELREFLEGPAGWDVARGKLANTKASDWTKIRERMGYIVNLFRTRHLQNDVVASPYTTEQLATISAGSIPDHPW